MPSSSAEGESIMTQPTSDIAFTTSVKAVQERMGSRPQYARMEEGAGWSNRITPELSDFLNPDQGMGDRRGD